MRNRTRTKKTKKKKRTSCKKSLDVTKSANQSNFSKINRSIRRSSFVEHVALQSITNSGVIGIWSSSSLHLAATYKQPTAKHSKYFGRTFFLFDEEKKTRKYFHWEEENEILWVSLKIDRVNRHLMHTSQSQNALMLILCEAMLMRDFVGKYSLHPGSNKEEEKCQCGVKTRERHRFGGTTEGGGRILSILIVLFCFSLLFSSLSFLFCRVWLCRSFIIIVIIIRNIVSFFSLDFFLLHLLWR